MKSYTIYFNEKTDKDAIKIIERAVKKHKKGVSDFGRIALIAKAKEIIANGKQK